MKDNIYLLVTAILVAITASAFWRYFGENGFPIISSVIIIGLAADNFYLRRKLRSISQEK